MKKLILVGGDLAGGKSTYAGMIGKRFGITVLNKDRLKEILGDRFTARDREENLNLSKAAFDIMEYVLMSSAGPLVLESNFKAEEAARLAEAAEKGGFGVLSLRFTGDDAVLHRRFTERLNGPRHYVHRSQDFSALRDFSEMLEGLRAVRYPGKVVEVRCTDFSYAADPLLWREIETFLAE